MTIICSGSLAYDRLLNFPGVFADNIMADKIDLLNVCFVVDKASVAYGGTAGNIVYNLSLLGEKPLLAGCLGGDPEGGDYLKRLKEFDLSVEAVKVHPGTMTAGCTLVTDEKNNQLIFFNPGAMVKPSGFDPRSLPQPYDQHLAIVAPGGPEEMKSLCRAYRELGIRFIFDPGQQVPMFSAEELIDMLDGSFIFICNEYEFELFKKNSGLDTDGLFRHTECIIVTKGEKGSDLMVPGRGSQHVAAVIPRQVTNPTGAGDAYRAGLLKGLGKARPEHLISACRLGATVAAFCVEAEGGPQDHHFTLGEIAARHAHAFKEQLAL